MIIRILHDSGSTEYKSSNQYNMLLRSVRFYRATMEGDAGLLRIVFRSANDCHDWLDKYLLEFVELQAYLIKYHQLKSLEIDPHEA